MLIAFCAVSAARQNSTPHFSKLAFFCVTLRLSLNESNQVNDSATCVGSLLIGKRVSTAHRAR